MNRSVRKGIVAAVLAAGWVGSAGCAAFRARVREVDAGQERHLGTGYDYTDMRTVARGVVDALLASPFMEKQAEAPVMMIAGVENRTSQYVDTKNLTDRMRNLLFQNRAVRFVNEARREQLLREQGYQAANVRAGQQAEIGRQLGAAYMISGSLTEMKDTSPRQVRVSKTKVNYYKLTVEVTDLVSGEILWMTEEEFAREARLPLIGW